MNICHIDDCGLPYSFVCTETRCISNTCKSHKRIWQGRAVCAECYARLLLVAEVTAAEAAEAEELAKTCVTCSLIAKDVQACNKCGQLFCPKHLTMVNKDTYDVSTLGEHPGRYYLGGTQEVGLWCYSCTSTHCSQFNPLHHRPTSWEPKYSYRCEWPLPGILPW